MQQKNVKKSNVIVRALAFIFVKNWALKISAIVIAAAIWFLAIGLGGVI